MGFQPRLTRANLCSATRAIKIAFLTKTIVLDYCFTPSSRSLRFVVQNYHSLFRRYFGVSLRYSLRKILYNYIALKQTSLVVVWRNRTGLCPMRRRTLLRRSVRIPRLVSKLLYGTQILRIWLSPLIKVTFSYFYSAESPLRTILNRACGVLTKVGFFDYLC